MVGSYLDEPHDPHDDEELDLSPRQRHGLWGNTGWVIGVAGIVVMLLSLLGVLDDDSVGKIIGIIALVLGAAITAYGVSYMFRHRK